MKCATGSLVLPRGPLGRLAGAPRYAGDEALRPVLPIVETAVVRSKKTPWWPLGGV